ncbi:MAG: DNA translocase FtsK [Flexilinea sp.]
MEKKEFSAKEPKSNATGNRNNADSLLFDFLALILFMAGGLLWVGFSNQSSGYLLDTITGGAGYLLGSGRYFLVLAFITGGFLILLKQHSARPISIGLKTGIILFILTLSVFGLFSRYDAFSGGFLGNLIYKTLSDLIGKSLTDIVLWISGLLSIGLLSRCQRWMPRVFADISTGIHKLKTIRPNRTGGDYSGRAPAFHRFPANISDEYNKEKPSVLKLHKKDKENHLKIMIRNNQLPPLNLLEPEMGLIEKRTDVQTRIKEIETAMTEFGTPVDVIGFSVGPGIIQFQVTPGMVEKTGGRGAVIPKKIRVAQVAQRERDLAVRLGVANLSIQAPVPGESFIGIDMPNPDALKVRLRPLIESEEFQAKSSPLSVALGRDISGTPVVVDLEQMPHLLIAGTTNSGKSICLRSMAVCLIMNNTPEQLRVVMIDPKRVELFRFNGLPHLLGKVETEYERSIAVLGWAVQEMKNRYKLFETVGVRKLSSYNLYAVKNDQKPLPYIVIFIDELAEIVKGIDKQGQEYIDTLASLARATGMHLVVATQRPDTTIITGKIKTNIPARIALNVASAIDSRVIMGKQGAEKLLGRGDMYFVDPSLNVPVRIQGPLLTDEEIDSVVALWKKMAPKPAEEPELAPWEELIEAASGEETSRDEKSIKDAIRLVCRTRKASASYLQVKLNISFPKASRLLDRMEKIGVVGPVQVGGKAREVLWTEDEADSYGEDAGYQEES